MSVKSISTNPRDPINLFNEAPMSDSEFEELMYLVIHVTESSI